MDKEWFKLRDAPHPSGNGVGVWNEALVREAKDVRDEARRKNITVHFGRIVELLFLKGAELSKGHPDQKLKARSVFLGDNVKDQDFNYAVFEELGGAPPSIEAARALDALSLFSGYIQQMSDATSAYTQSFLKGPRTWVHLPKDRWPASWHGKYTDPVVPLDLALYGHPDAGGYWEEHCETMILECGFQRIDNWRSAFWHPTKRSLLVVYVDDFKLAAPTEHVAGIWKDLRSRIKLDEPT